jgi:UDP-N-acetylmuramoyl-tripeptide--D-alanyl-D-alanine ligase
MDLTVAEVAGAAGGRILEGDPDAIATSFSYDSRRLEPGACFFALQGERDGHDFVESAFRRGAVAAVVSRDPGDEHRHAGCALIEVADTLAALGACGRVARARLEGATVVGITGSAGKTSTKDFAAAALARRFQVTASPGSFNNESGLPLTLLSATPETDVVVAEMGARFAGNIRELCEIARPTIGVVTNIGLAHAEYLGSRDAIAKVKGELLDALPADGIAVLNADDDMTAAMGRGRIFRVVPVGYHVDFEEGVQVGDVVLDDQLRPELTIRSPWGTFRTRLAMRGHHQALNAGLAAAVALVTGVPAEQVGPGLADATGASWRMQLQRSAGGLTVLNDAYNASPTTVAAALRSFAALPVPGRRIAVLGEMRELGDVAAAEHRNAGRLAAELRVDVVVAVGAAARPLAVAARDGGVDDVVEVDTVADALAAVVSRAGASDAVLVKASRAVALESVGDALTAGAADSPGERAAATLGVEAAERQP